MSRKNPAFITVKNHQENFQTTRPCRLINPSKSGKDQPSTNEAS